MDQKLMTRASPRRFFRRALLPTAALAAGATLAVPGDADAATLTSVGMVLGEELMSAAIQEGLGLSVSALMGSSALTTADIQGVVTTELQALQLSNDVAKSQDVISYAADYYRGTTVTELKSSLSDASGIADDALSVMNNLEGLSNPIDGAATYKIMASIHLSFMKEVYEITKALSLLDPANYTTAAADKALDNVKTHAGDIATQLESLGATYDADWTSLYNKTKNDQNACGFGDKCHHDRYCATGPDGEVCGAEVYLVHCDQNNSACYVENTSNQQEAMYNGEIAMFNGKISQRDTILGPQFYETLALVEKTAEGHFAYCGDGTCSASEIAYDTSSNGELDFCPVDCSDRSAMKTAFSYTNGAPQTLLSGSKAELRWQGDGNLVLYDTTTSPWSAIWKTDTNADTVTFGSDGSLKLTKSGSTVWASGTSTTHTPVTLALTDKAVHIQDEWGEVLWSSTTDAHHHAELTSRFCYDTSQAATILSTSYGLVTWQGDGNLVVYDASHSALWASSTGGTGRYLCNQDDGKFVVYDTSLNTLWSSGAYTGSGGDLVLEGNQLRTLAPDGSILWSRQGCSAWGCSFDGMVKSASPVCYSNSQPTTILDTGVAHLDWQGDGNLVLYDYTTSPRTARWATYTSGDQLCFQGDGNLVVYKSGAAKWASNTTGSSKATTMTLAGCNFFLGDGSTGKAVYSTNTACTN